MTAWTEMARAKETITVIYTTAVTDHQFLDYVQPPLIGLMTLEQVRYLVQVLGTTNKEWIERETGYYHHYQNELVDDLDALFFVRGAMEREAWKHRELDR